jgi:hypothetical protein
VRSKAKSLPSGYYSGNSTRLRRKPSLGIRRLARVIAVAVTRWMSICSDCAGSIDSVVELLQDRLAKAVMDRVSRQGEGLFPRPKEIKLSCSCADWADMCKHVAGGVARPLSVTYGVSPKASPNFLLGMA